MSHALAGTLQRVFQNWADQKGWQKLIQNGITMDFSWSKLGVEYEVLYRGLAGA